MNPRDQCLYVCDSDNDSVRRVTMQGMHISSHLSISTDHGWCRHCHYICCWREDTTKTIRNHHGLHAWHLLCYLPQQHYLQDNIIRCAILYAFFALCSFIFWWNSPASQVLWACLLGVVRKEAAMDSERKQVSTDSLVLHLISGAGRYSSVTNSIIWFERSHVKVCSSFVSVS